MASENKPSRTYFIAVAATVVSGIAIGLIFQQGFTLAILPLLAGGLLLWAVVWTGGFQLGAAFADWLNRRWNK